ncbi:MAG: hypothetical protein AMJ81_06050 [Phycisphaerae bacterium SM23_33]|nr:MAG: hypothetical protein AMJ81_06050 [Phycisphaerae bacterium SM23_33]
MAAALALAALPVAPGEARAQMVVQRWAVGQQAAHPGTIQVLDPGGGAPVINVDLQVLGRNTRIHRALLFVNRRQLDPADPEAMLDNEVFPILTPGEALKLTERPLAVAPPRLDCFDATEIVQGWVRDPKTNHGLLVEHLPGWVAEDTHLEIAYAGRPIRVPRQAAGLKVRHSAGQTFITWAEIDPLVAAEKVTWGQIKEKLAQAGGAFHYHIYTHTQPIDEKTIASAELLARVGPLSGYNTSGRNVEYLTGQAMIKPDRMGELTENHNQLVNAWDMDHPRMDRCPVQRLVIFERAGPLPVGTGLYVHSPPRPGRRYYAVVSCLEGTENTVDFSPANSLTEPVDETAGPGEPVCQGEGLHGPFFDYPGSRKVYVQWCAPPLSPRPNMYFNWSVLVPPKVKDGAPVELYFHPADHSHAQPARKLLADSIQIAAQDYPFSGWYGFNEFAGTLRNPREGYVRDHTQKRIAAFLDWAVSKFPIDPERVLAVGWDGAALTALHQPQRFACVLIEGFQAQVLEAQAAGKFASAWGPRSPHVRDERDRPAWSWAELDKLVLESAKDPLPLFVCQGYSWGRASSAWGKGQGRFYQAALKARQPIQADWTWAGGRLAAPDKYTGLWRGLDLTRRTPIAALTNSSLDSDEESNGQMNMAYSWKDVTDQPQEFAMTLVNGSGDARVDFTPRRLWKFKVAAGEELLWEIRNIPVGQRGASTLPARSGRARADANGLLTLRGLSIPAHTGLVIRLTRPR